MQNCFRQRTSTWKGPSENLYTAAYVLGGGNAYTLGTQVGYCA